jgi:hypothetical protein
MSFNSVLSQFNSVHVDTADVSENSIQYYTPTAFNFSFKIYQTDAIIEAKQLFICLFIFSDIFQLTFYPSISMNVHIIQLDKIVKQLVIM